MNVACLVVEAREERASEIARLSSQLGYCISVEETQSMLNKMLASPNYFIRLAVTQSNSVIGWVSAERRCTLESGELVELTGLIVDPNARRQGVAKALVTAAEQWVNKSGFESIRVRSNISRVESHEFYQRMGFVRSKTQHVYAKRLLLV
jgi:GNAT superfamily N-acetyltransferase